MLSYGYRLICPSSRMCLSLVHVPLVVRLSGEWLAGLEVESQGGAVHYDRVDRVSQGNNKQARPGHSRSPTKTKKLTANYG